LFALRSGPYTNTPFPQEFLKEDPEKINASIQLDYSTSIYKNDQSRTPITSNTENVNTFNEQRGLNLEEQKLLWDASSLFQADNNVLGDPTAVTFASEEFLVRSGTEILSESEYGENYTHSHQQPTIDVPCPPTVVTDSGYKSMGYRQNINKDEEQDDTQTVITDNQELNVPKDVKEKLALAFSSELVRGLGGALGNWNDQETLRDALGDILKEFAIRCGRSACAGQQKDATTFVRHYRWYVFLVSFSFHSFLETENKVSRNNIF
jgi:hypothetical protein